MNIRWLIQTLTPLWRLRWVGALAAAPIGYVILAERNAGRSDLAAISHRLDRLRQQLATVDVMIKRLLKDIDRKRSEEDAIKEQLEKAQDLEQVILKNLKQASDAYDELRQTISGVFP